MVKRQHRNTLLRYYISFLQRTHTREGNTRRVIKRSLGVEIN